MTITSLKARFWRSPIQNTLLLIVITIHFTFLLTILISPISALSKKKTKLLNIRTVIAKVQTKEGKKTSSAIPRTSQVAYPNTKSIPQPPPQTSPPRPQAKPKQAPLPKAVVQQHSPTPKKEPAIADKQLSKNTTSPPPPKTAVQNRAKISDSLLRDLQESIAKMDQPNPSTAKKTMESSKTLAPISLQIDTPNQRPSDSQVDQNKYTETLINHLHHSLSLPEYGEVKIQLSLRQDGTVVKVVVLKAQSEKNRKYLEYHLPQLRFPQFEGIFTNKKEHAFILTFCNE